MNPENKERFKKKWEFIVRRVWGYSEEEFEQMKKHIAIRTETRNPCSCEACRQYRGWYKQKTRPHLKRELRKELEEGL